jgi:serine phosphatase RsbU (regulator of sigma subunit)
MSEPAFGAALQNLGTALECPAGSLLIEAGALDDSAYWLLSGTLEVYIESPVGRLKLAELSPPAIVGEVAALAGIPRSANVRCLSDSKLRRIPAKTLAKAGLQEPQLLLHLTAAMGQNINRVNQAVSTYAQALAALEKGGIDDTLLEKLANPPLELRGFATAFERFVREITHKRRTNAELASAGLIQQSFLPKIDGNGSWPSGVKVAARMRAAREVGGDFYDVIKLGDDRMLFTVGDVSGKGMPASLFMAVTISTLRSLASSTGEPGEIAAAANEILSKNNSENMFATAFIGVLDCHERILTYSNCGHCAPYRVSQSGASTTLPATGLPLGLYASLTPQQAQVRLAPGDRLFVFSDGVTESTNLADEQFDEDRLERLLLDLGPMQAEEVIAAVIKAVDAFAGEAGQFDDLTCLALHC